DQPSTNLLDFRKDVRGEDDRVLPAKILDEAAYLPDLIGIQSHGRFVQDQDGRVVHEGFRESDSLTVTLGQVLDDAPSYIAESAAAHDVVQPTGHGASRNPFQAGPIAKVLLDAH